MDTHTTLPTFGKTPASDRTDSLREFQDFLHMFYLDSYIPCYLYENGELLLSEPSQTELTLPPEKYTQSLFQTDQRLRYLFTDYGMYFCSLTLSGFPAYTLVCGPVGTIPLSESDRHTLFSDYIVPEEYRASFQAFFKSIPRLSLSAFLTKMLFLNYCLNQECRYVREFLPMQTAEQIQDSTEKTLQEKEDYHHNNSYELEEIIAGYIRSGNPAGLRSLLYNESNLHAGIIAPTSLRQLKNLFIVSVTLATRAAIEGGLDTDTAFHLSDELIQSSENSQSAEYLQRLMAQTPYTFAEKVAEVKMPVSSDEIIQSALRFIQQNTNRRITPADVAEHVGFSRSYFSTYFKKNLGFTIQDFITRCKLEEARYLLRYTTKSLALISSYLCFSSQSHFQTAFKKQFGVTPLQYRRNAGNAQY